MKLLRPVLITIEPGAGQTTTVMNRLGQMNTGPTMKVLRFAEQCMTSHRWHNSSCFCCECLPEEVRCCQNASSDLTDIKCSPALLHCVEESNLWYDMYSPGKTLVNQSISGRYKINDRRKL